MPIGWNLYSEDADENLIFETFVASENVLDLLLALYPNYPEASYVDPATGEIAPIYSTGNTRVTASSDPTYMITIPRSVDFGRITRDMVELREEFPVTIENALFENRANVTVAVLDDDFRMLLDGTNTSFYLPYQLWNTDELANGETFVTFLPVPAIPVDPLESCEYAVETEDTGYSTTFTGSVVILPHDDLARAGDYSGTMTFVCAYNN